MPIVEVDGQELEFPDDMSQDAIKQVLQSKFPQAPKADPMRGDDKGAFASGVQGFNSAVPFGNRITAGLAAGVLAPFTDMTTSELYNTARANQKATEEAHPGANLAGAGLGIAATLPVGFSKAVATTPGLGNAANALTKASTATGNFVRGGASSAARIARGAAVAGGTGAVYGYGASKNDLDSKAALDDAATGFGVGAAAGIALPVTGALIKRASDATGGVVNRVGSLLGNEKAQANIADNILAKRFLEEGFTPEQIAEKVAAAKASGLSPTLGEATGSSGVLQAEKSVIRGTGKGANLMREALNERNRTTIPQTIGDFATGLETKAGDVSGAYQAASDEAAKRMFRVQNAIANPTDDVKLFEAKPLEAAKKAVTRVNTAIEERLGELGDVSNVESLALNKAKAIMANAERRGGTFDALLDAKKQMDNLYIDGADAAVQKNASRYVGQFTKQINETLAELAPEGYKKATAAARTRMAAGDIREALDSTNDGSLGVLYNKVWAKPELRNDFLRKLPDDATRQEATNLFMQLENVKRGFGGSDTAFNLPANQKLAQEAGLGFDASLANPLQSVPSVLERIGGYAQPGVYNKIAEQSLNPNVERLLKAMQKAGGGGGARLPIAPVGVAGTLAGQEGKQPAQIYVNPSLNPYKGGDSAVPTVTQIDPLSYNTEMPASAVTADFMHKMAKVESGGNPNAQAKTSSAKGLYQFTSGKWREMVSKYGDQYGVGVKDIFDPRAQHVMATLSAMENERALAAAIGRQPNETDLYAAHFLGTGGAKKLISLLGKGENAVKAFPEAARANTRIFYDKMRPRTVDEVYNILQQKMS